MEPPLHTDFDKANVFCVRWALACFDAGGGGATETSSQIEAALKQLDLPLFEKADGDTAGLEFVQLDPAHLLEGDGSHPIGIHEPIGRFLFVLLPTTASGARIEEITSFIRKHQPLQDESSAHVVAVFESPAAPETYRAVEAKLAPLGVRLLDPSAPDWQKLCAGVIEENWQAWLLRISIRRGGCYAFVSYSTNDRLDGVGAGEAIKRAITEVLPNKMDPANRIWVDTDRLKLGDNWKLSLQLAVKSAPMIFFCVTRSFLEKATCRRHLEEAVDPSIDYDSAWIRRELFWASGSSRKMVPIVLYEDEKELPHIQRLWKQLTGASEQWQQVRLYPDDPKASYQALKSVVAKYADTIEDNFNKIANLRRSLTRRSRDYSECFDLETANRLGAHLVQIDQTRLSEAARSWLKLLRSAQLHLGDRKAENGSSAHYLHQLSRKEELSPSEAIILLTAYPGHLHSRRNSRLNYLKRASQVFAEIGGGGDVPATAWNEHLHQQELEAEAKLLSGNPEATSFAPKGLPPEVVVSDQVKLLNDATQGHDFTAIVDRIHDVLPPFLWFKGASNWWSERSIRFKELASVVQTRMWTVRSLSLAAAAAVSVIAFLGYNQSGILAPKPENDNLDYSVDVERLSPMDEDWVSIFDGGPKGKQAHQADTRLTTGLLPFTNYRVVYRIHADSTDTSEAGSIATVNYETGEYSWRWFRPIKVDRPLFAAPLRIQFEINGNPIPNMEGGREMRKLGELRDKKGLELYGSGILIKEYQTGSPLHFIFRDYTMRDAEDRGIYFSLSKEKLDAYKNFRDQRSATPGKEALSEDLVTQVSIALEPKLGVIDRVNSMVELPDGERLKWDEFLDRIDRAAPVETTTTTMTGIQVFDSEKRRIDPENLKTSDFRAGEQLTIRGPGFAPQTVTLRGVLKKVQGSATYLAPLEIVLTDRLEPIRIDKRLVYSDPDQWDTLLKASDLEVTIKRGDETTTTSIDKVHEQWLLHNLRIGDHVSFSLAHAKVEVISKGSEPSADFEITADWLNAQLSEPALQLDLTPTEETVTIRFRYNDSDVSLFDEEEDLIKRDASLARYQQNWRESFERDATKYDGTILQLEGVPIAAAPEIQLPFTAYDIAEVNGERLRDSHLFRLDSQLMKVALKPKRVSKLRIKVTDESEGFDPKKLYEGLLVSIADGPEQRLNGDTLSNVPHGARIRFSHPNYKVEFVGSAQSPGRFNANPEFLSGGQTDAPIAYPVHVTELPARAEFILAGDWRGDSADVDLQITSGDEGPGLPFESINANAIALELKTKRHMLRFEARGYHPIEVPYQASLQRTEPFTLEFRFADITVFNEHSLADTIRETQAGRTIVIRESPSDQGPWLIDKPITIKGSLDKASPTQALTGDPQVNGPVFSIRSSNVRLENLWIEQKATSDEVATPHRHAVEIRGRSGGSNVVNIDDPDMESALSTTNIRLENCVLRSEAASGLFIHGQDANATVTGGSIQDCKLMGVAAVNYADLTLTGVEIDNNGQHGIALFKATLHLKNSVVKNSKQAGIRLGPIGLATIESTEFFGNTESNIFISGETTPVSSDPKYIKATARLTNCTLRGNCRTGLYALGYSEVFIAGGNISGSTDQGIWAGDHSILDLGSHQANGVTTPLLISKNHGHGLRLEGGARITANQVNFDLNDKSGIQASGPSGSAERPSLTLNGGSISQNGVYGINLLGLANIRTKGVIIQANRFKDFSDDAKPYF